MRKSAANITPSQLAHDLGIHPRTVQRWCRDLRVEHCRTPTGRVRFTRVQADAILAMYASSEPLIEVDTPNPRFNPGLKVVVPLDRSA